MAGTAIDLFAGAGGTSAGLRAAGLRVVAAVELDSRAAASYRLNDRDALMVEFDITRVHERELRSAISIAPGELDLLAASPPCQDFSRFAFLRKNKKWDERILLFEPVRFARELRPRAVLIENVPVAARSPEWEAVTSRFRDIGYHTATWILDAADYGTPQRRKRAFLAALRDGAVPGPPAPLGAPPDAAAALAGVPADDYLQRGLRMSDVVRERVKAIPPDGSAADLPDRLRQEQPRKRFRAYQRIPTRGPSRTITSKCLSASTGPFVHPFEDRGLTMREAALLQGFPMDYRFADFSLHSVATQIGNAVPPPLARACAEHLLRPL